MRHFLLGTTLVLLLSLAGLAKEQHLVSTSSDKDEKVETFAIETDESGKLSRLWHREPSQPDRSYTLAQLEKGVVLKRESGEDAIRFYASGVDPTEGGSFRMEYLFSGVPPKEYKSMTLELRNKDNQWSLFAGQDKRPIKGMHFLTNVTSFLGIKKIIGIRAVQLQR